MAEMSQQQAILLVQIVGLPDGSVQAHLMPGLDPEEAKAMCNTGIQALAQRQAQLFNATREVKPKILVPQMVLR